MTIEITEKTLTHIFGQTDRISFGFFTIIKPVGEEFDRATALVKDRPVPLSTVQKQTLALLISQKGLPVEGHKWASAQETPKMKALTQKLNETFCLNERKSIKAQIANAYKVQIHRIREKLKEAFPDAHEQAEVLDCIDTTGAHYQSGIKGHRADFTAKAYRLLTPE